MRLVYLSDFFASLISVTVNAVCTPIALEHLTVILPPCGLIRAASQFKTILLLKMGEGNSNGMGQTQMGTAFGARKQGR